VARAIGGAGDAAGWVLAGAAGAVFATQAAGRTRSMVAAAAQTVAPHLWLAVAAIALRAVVRRRWAQAAVAALVGAGGVGVLAPVVWPRQRVVPAAGGLRVATVNLLYTNGATSSIADDLLGRDLDVIVFTEYTAAHKEVLDDHPLAGALCHHIDREGPRARGVAVWSRFPLAERARLPTVNHSVDAVVDGPDGAVRILGVHTPTPVYDFDEWIADLATIRAAVADPDGPTLVIGDFNATCWHPPMRAILAAGYVDAHLAGDRVLAASWPVDGARPGFAQLDHALVGGGLAATAVDNFPVTGSDHRGVVVSVATRRRAAP
jgi:endonuclease/exonuclease/phosphatase (EEP) superfamily protein YafD